MNENREPFKIIFSSDGKTEHKEIHATRLQIIDTIGRHMQTDEVFRACMYIAIGADLKTRKEDLIGDALGEHGLRLMSEAPIDQKEQYEKL